MGADQAQVDPGDRGHADEVRGAGEEGCEGGGVGEVSAGGQAGGGGDHLLLGDEHLEEALWMLLDEVRDAGGVRDLAVQGDHPGVDLRERGERRTVGLPGRDLLPELEGGQVDLTSRDARGRLARGRLRSPHLQGPPTAERVDGLLGLVFGHRLAVPVLLILDAGDALALERAGKDHQGPVQLAVGEREGVVDRRDVVAVYDHGSGTEGLDPGGVGVQVPAERGLAPLAQSVHIHEGDQVRQLVVGGGGEGLPHGALGELAVPGQDPDAVRGLLQVLAGQRDADPIGQPLAERAGGDVHPGQHRGGVALETLVEASVALHQLLLGDHADGAVDGVQQR